MCCLVHILINMYKVHHCVQIYRKISLSNKYAWIIEIQWWKDNKSTTINPILTTFSSENNLKLYYNYNNVINYNCLVLWYLLELARKTSASFSRMVIKINLINLFSDHTIWCIWFKFIVVSLKISLNFKPQNIQDFKIKVNFSH